MDYIIDINETGGVEALHNDEVDLRSLGKVSMKRASNVLFDESLQVWTVVPVGYKREDLPLCYTGHETYKKAVEFEVAVLNRARARGWLDKLITSEGIDMAYTVYRELTRHD